MTDDTTRQDRFRRNPPPAGLSAYLQTKDPDAEEASCKAFGYLRGIRDSATSVEFRFLDGNSTWFAYAMMGTWKYNPSEGLLLKFSGDLVYLVLIRGSNLDRGIDGKATDLIHAGLQRQHVLWLREMTPAEIREVGEMGPTIDSIQVAEFESHATLKEWLKAQAPAFVQGPV